MAMFVPSVEPATAQHSRPISFDRLVPSKAACQPCRSRHQKCKGERPICSRCISERKTCVYEPSKRGRVFAHLHGKRKRRDEDEHTSNNSERQLEGGSRHLIGGSRDSFIAENFDNVFCHSTGIGTKLSDTLTAPSPRSSLKNAATPGEDELSVALLPNGRELAPKDAFLSTFYTSFWPSHPFVPSRNDIREHLRRDPNDSLVIIMNFIGSLYRGRAQVRPPMPALPASNKEDIYSVQMFILFAIAFHMSGHNAEAVNALSRAVDVALKTSLYRHAYPTSQHQYSLVLEESQRRTWWELYILDILFATLNQTRRSLEGVQPDVPLPREVDHFEAKMASPSLTLADFDRHILEPDKYRRFGASAYRIVAARALNKINNVCQQTSQPSGMDCKDAELTLENLIVHMPRDIQIVLNEDDGSVNPMLFQTHMLIHAATIFLHRPHSALNTFSQPKNIACAPSFFTYSDSTIYHTKKCVSAADDLSQLTTIGAPVADQTPFFTCALALQSLVHLGVYGVPQWQPQKHILAQQVQLSLGALGKLGEIWETPAGVRRQVSDLARLVLRPLIGTSTDGNQCELAATGSDVVTPGQLTLGGANALPSEDWFEEFMQEAGAA